MALADILRWPASRKVGLVDVIAPQPLRQWTVDGTFPAVYYSDVTRITVAGALQDGVDLTEQGSTSDVNTSGGFYYDQSTDRLYVKNPFDSTLVQVKAAFYIATHVKDFASEGFARQSRMIGVPKIRLAISTSFGGTQKTSGGSVEVINTDAIFDALPKLNFDAGDVSLKVAADLLR